MTCKLILLWILNRQAKIFLRISSRSFEYETKTIGRTPANNNRLNTEVVVPLKYLSNFWRSLELPLINCELELAEL